MTALVTPPPGGPPERVGRYEILAHIGSGGMATVYLARAEVMPGLYRDVALKMMRPQFSSGSDEAASVLLDEARLTASIRHSNVVMVHEAVEDPLGVYMVMDYVAGDSLTGLIRNAMNRGERVPEPVAARILCDALAGLHAAHELCDAVGRPMNVVHRDYSPSNILVGVDGSTRLTDFGIAKAESRISATASGVVKGKLGYMAPEQLLARKLDRRCDIWAAGVVAWECLAGERLFGQLDHGPALLRMVQEEPPRLRTVRPDLPQSLDDAIASALTTDPARRCPTAAELRRRMLEAWREVGPVAEPSEVGEYVTALMGAKMRERKEAVARVLKRREERASDPRTATPLPGSAPSSPRASLASAPSSGTLEAFPATPRASSSGTLDTANTAVLAPITEATTRAFTRGARRPTRAIIIGAGTLGAAAIVVLAALRAAPRPDPVSASAPPVTAPSPSSSPSPSPSPSVAALASPPAPATSAASASLPTPAHDAAVLVRANADLTSLKVGDRVLLLPEPARQAEVRLAPSEQASAIHVEAVSREGRRASATIAPGSAEVTLVFASAPRPPSSTRSSGASSDAPPALAPSPFGN